MDHHNRAVEACRLPPSPPANQPFPAFLTGKGALTVDCSTIQTDRLCALRFAYTCHTVCTPTRCYCLISFAS